eukprot:14557978-Ditylum_brightwellii.AAC.1
MKCVLGIWLLYAQSQATFASYNDACFTYDHIKKKGTGKKDGSLYISIAKFELNGEESGIGHNESTQNGERAIEILQIGISKEATPLQDLREKLKMIEQSLSIPSVLAQTTTFQQCNKVSQRSDNQLNLLVLNKSKGTMKIQQGNREGQDYKMPQRGQDRNSDERKPNNQHNENNQDQSIDKTDPL